MRAFGIIQTCIGKKSILVLCIWKEINNCILFNNFLSTSDEFLNFSERFERHNIHEDLRRRIAIPHIGQDAARVFRAVRRYWGSRRHHGQTDSEEQGIWICESFQSIHFSTFYLRLFCEKFSNFCNPYLPQIITSFSMKSYHIWVYCNFTTSVFFISLLKTCSLEAQFLVACNLKLKFSVNEPQIKKNLLVKSK